MFFKTLLFCLVSLFILDKEVLSQNNDAEVIRYASFCEAGVNRLTQTDSITIQINNRIGDKYAEISLPYSKNEKISDLDAWIENMDGTLVRVLKRSEIVDKSAISDMSLYEDTYNKCFELKHNIYPYRIVYTYKTTFRNFISLTWWSPIIYSEIPTRSAKLRVTISKNMPFYKYVNNISGGYHIDSTENNIILQWNASYTKPLKPEIFSQPDKFKPFVIVAPLYFQYGVDGSTKDWESFGNWQYRLIKDLDILPDGEKIQIATLINGIEDKSEIIKILYHYLQDHTRYINVSIGIGGLKPYPASYVAQNKYGDCKALTNYMKAMLSFAGIESFYTVVYASEQPSALIKSYAGPQFNHVVLGVPLKNDTIWLENTLNTNPFSYMGTFTQNREALWVNKNQSKLVRIPALRKQDDMVSYKLVFDLDVSGKTKATMNVSFKGRDFEIFNQLHSGYNDNEKDKIIRDYMPFDNYEVLNCNLIKIHRDTARIELNATLNLNKYLKPLSNEYYLSIYPSRIPAFSQPAYRILPVVLPYPVCNSDSLIYNLPSGYELKTKLDPIFIKTLFGKFEMALKAINGKFYLIKKFELYAGTYSTEQYSDFCAFLQSVKDAEKKKIIIKPIN
jgi:hypothetical protein